MMETFWLAACGCSPNCHGARRYSSEKEAREKWERHGGRLIRHEFIKVETVLEEKLRAAKTS